MQRTHVPSLGSRYWAALCLASVFGANSGDFFAHNLGLGHVAGIPFLAVALAVVLVIERFDSLVHEAYYWTAIIIVRTAATNFADFFSADLRLAKIWVTLALTVVLVLAVWLSWQWLWSQRDGKDDARATLLRADLPYWLCMFVAGTLGTVLGDYCSHDWRMGNAGASAFLCAILLAMFLLGRRQLLWSLPFYWATIVMIRAAGTVVGDLFAGRQMLGLALSTLVTGVVFVGLLLIWRNSRSETELRRVGT